ncbi:hypothetical protein JCM8547_000411 [Rhodosporidiobolus lusitaniae]
MMPAIPAPLSSFYQKFPLVLLDPLQPSTPAPSPAQLWALGPPPSGHSESVDPLCRVSQAFARFAQVPLQRETRWVGWDNVEAAPGGVLPAVHTETGDLLVGEEVDNWVGREMRKIEQGGKKRASNGGASEFGSPGRDDAASTPAAQDPTHQAYFALVESTLLPAVLSSLYLSPPGTAPLVVPSTPKPVLSALAGSLLSWNDRSRRIEEVKRLRGAKGGKKSVLDLEEVEREAKETIEALEEKLRAAGGKGEWFGGASSPTRLDALIYALLSIVRILPSSCDYVLRPALERSPALLAWVKKHDP